MFLSVSFPVLRHSPAKTTTTTRTSSAQGQGEQDDNGHQTGRQSAQQPLLLLQQQQRQTSTTKNRRVLTDTAEAEVDEIIHSTVRQRRPTNPRARDSILQYCDVLNPNIFVECQKKREDVQQPCTDHAFIARIANGYVSDNSIHPEVPGTVFTNAKVFQWQAYVREKIPEGDPPNWTKDGVTKVHNLGDCLISVLQAYPTAKGHFPHETLPRLLYLAQKVPDPDCPILVSVKTSGSVEFVTRFLRLLPSTIRERLLYWQGHGHYYFAKNLHVANEGPYCWQENPHRGGMSTFFQPSVVQLVRSYFVPTTTTNVTEPHILVIRRPPRQARALVAHNELVRAIRQAHPSRTVLEFTAEGSLQDHVDAFAHASHVIGPHGAGFANLVFCSPSVTQRVVEIGWRGRTTRKTQVMEMDNMYYRLADSLELDYRLVLARGDYGTPLVLSNVQMVLDAAFDLEPTVTRKITMEDTPR